MFGFRECSGVSYLFRPHPTAKRRIILWNSKVYASTCPENAATLSAISPNGVTIKNAGSDDYESIKSAKH